MGTKIAVAAFTSIALSLFFAVLLLIAIIIQSQTEKTKPGGCKENECFSIPTIIAFIGAVVVILVSGYLIKKQIKSKFSLLDDEAVKNFEEMSNTESDTDKETTIEIKSE